MFGPVFAFVRHGHAYELFKLTGFPEWSLFEDFGDEAALVGLITQRGTVFSIECLWRFAPAARSVEVAASSVDEAVTALLDLAAGGDPRGAGHGV